jgi:hypothetical protein
VELTSEQRINAPREQVYAALNDLDILRQCIPGCESLEAKSDTELEATVSLKMGPVKAKFKGQVELSNLVPPESYSISGQGSGGAAGFAKGGADIKLVEDGGATVMHFDVKADVGGRFAQLGNRLIDSTAKTLSGKFFEKFCELVESGGEAEAAPSAEAAPPESGGDSKTERWIIALIVVAVALVVIYALN